MKTIKRDGCSWFIAETDEDRSALTRQAEVLRHQAINHSFIYDGPPGNEHPVVEELAILSQ